MPLARNFEFEGFSQIRLGDRIVDLHNAYDIEALGTDLEGFAFKIKFLRNQYAINPDTLPSNPTLLCSGNVRVSFNNLNLITAPLNHEGIEIGYFDKNCDWDSFIDENIAATQEPIGLHIEFMNGLVVRVYCDNVIFSAVNQ